MTDALVHALGDYASTASPDLLLWSRNDRHPTERMVLYGRRFVAASELPEGRRLNEALVKQITGSDRFRARYMFKDEIEFTRTWVATIDTNHKPRVDASDDAIWQRIIVIPFEQQFRGTGREEKGLLDTLKNDPDASHLVVRRGMARLPRERRHAVPGPGQGGHACVPRRRGRIGWLAGRHAGSWP